MSVFGIRGPSGTYTENTSYVIDGGAPSFWTNSSNIPAVEYQVEFYKSPQLTNTQHTLLITNFGDWFWLDSMNVTVPDDEATGGDSSVSEFRVVSFQ